MHSEWVDPLDIVTPLYASCVLLQAWFWDPTVSSKNWPRVVIFLYKYSCNPNRGLAGKVFFSNWSMDCSSIVVSRPLGWKARHACSLSMWYCWKKRILLSNSRWQSPKADYFEDCRYFIFILLKGKVIGISQSASLPITSLIIHRQQVS